MSTCIVVNHLQPKEGLRDQLIELLREFAVSMHAEPGGHPLLGPPADRRPERSLDGRPSVLVGRGVRGAQRVDALERAKPRRSACFSPTASGPPSPGATERPRQGVLLGLSPPANWTSANPPTARGAPVRTSRRHKRGLQKKTGVESRDFTGVERAFPETTSPDPPRRSRPNRGLPITAGPHPSLHPCPA